MIRYLLRHFISKEEKSCSIETFSEMAELKPYAAIIAEAPDIANNLKEIYPNKIKNNRDCVIELYKYNIKLSRAIYPYLSILENLIKIKTSDYLKRKFGENFYCNEELFLDLLELDDFDRKILYEYFNHKINKFVREEIMNKYKRHDNSISKKAVRNKLSQIKKGIAILSDASEYRFKNTNCSMDNFIETKPTLNYWITLFEIKGLYLKNNSSAELDFKQIFPNAAQEDARTLKTISQKLDDIRLLRNSISHYSKIIYTDISKSLDLWDIYENIKELFYLLGYDDINQVTEDIRCCKDSDFELLYKEFDFLHKTFKKKYKQVVSG